MNKVFDWFYNQGRAKGLLEASLLIGNAGGHITTGQAKEMLWKAYIAASPLDNARDREAENVTANPNG